MLNQARQGDVFIRRVDTLPANATAVAPENGHVILAHGEVTGHAHRVRDPKLAQMFADGDRRFLSVAADTAVVHEEHGAIPLTPGTYEVVRQREYTPTEIRNVAD